MDITLLFRGLVLGLSIAAPVGPIGLLCIRRTLAHGRATGLASGLGAATADGAYGLIGALGVSAVIGALTGAQFWLRIIGAVFLLYLGVRTMRERPAEREATVSARSGLVGAWASTFALTLSNPMTILSFMAMFAGVGAPAHGTDAALLVVGVFAGSALWWLTLSTIVGLLHSRFSPARLRLVNADFRF
ncbi:MAG: LysE family translocator [Chloroflexi bacterium]|nr:LysE family translocator [Chloroflexota bacterium]